MKPSLALFRIPRRLASEVIKSAQSAEKQGATNAYFAELPPVLSRFFEKFPPSPFREYSAKPTLTNAENANPFLPNRHPVTNSWHKPKYSMRRQADLWKAAYRFGIEHLMPTLLHNRTFYEERYNQPRKVRGAQLFKLRKGERIAPMREKEVQDARGKLDGLIADRKGKRFEKFVANKGRAGFV